MSLAKISSIALEGLEAYPIIVEVDIAAGLPCTNIVGLPDKAVEEARDRVRSAIKNAGQKYPQGRTTINLAPADVKKEGPAYDLPIAVAILSADEQLPKIDSTDYFIGELALDGTLRHVNGVLSMAQYLKDSGAKRLFLPEQNAAEAGFIRDLTIVPVKNLADLIAYLKGEIEINPYQLPKEKRLEPVYEADFAYIKGQEQAKRALEIAASGAHNILLSGPPGSGKTLLAKALPSILPTIEQDEMIEVSKIYSVAGYLKNQPLIESRPFRSPHHTTSNIALIGGGQWPRPGEISLAHLGVLFLDEFPEFPRTVLEVLRQPLEDGQVTISRASGSLTFPARFILVAAQNPCPCGYFGDVTHECTCSPTQIIKYRKRISGPLLDRIDLHIDVPRLKYETLSDKKVAESSFEIRERVNQARKIQAQRFANRRIRTNAEMDTKLIGQYCGLDSEGQSLMKNAVDNLSLSARSYHRILKLARTIADLESSELIKTPHLAEALQYRQKEQAIY